MIGTGDARASYKSVAGASCGVAALGLAAVGVRTLGEQLLDAHARTALSGWTSLVVAVASGLFLTAGVFRLARLRMAPDQHTALLGTGLILLGGLCLPLGGLAQLVLGSERSGTAGTGTFCAALVCTLTAGLATRSALVDLDGAVRAEQHQLTDLSLALTSVRGRADELTVWREQLTHDARNACAGVRAAMDILQRYDGRVDAETTQRLRLAAVEEIGYLEHLLFRSSAAPCERFAAGELVEQVAANAQALGALVRVIAGSATGPVDAYGRPGDVAAVLRNLFVNAQTHAPGSRVDLRVATDGGTVTITCSDDGPGLGLHAARELMREQGGELTVGEAGPGATFVLTLRRAAAPSVRQLQSRIPGQRRSSGVPAPVHEGELAS